MRESPEEEAICRRAICARILDWRGILAALVEIVWPIGTKQTFCNVAADAFYELDEGTDILGMQKIARDSKKKH